MSFRFSAVTGEDKERFSSEFPLLKSCKNYIVQFIQQLSTSVLYQTKFSISKLIHLKLLDKTKILEYNYLQRQMDLNGFVYTNLTALPDLFLDMS